MKKFFNKKSSTPVTDANPYAAPPPSQNINPYAQAPPPAQDDPYSTKPRLPSGPRSEPSPAGLPSSSALGGARYGGGAPPPAPSSGSGYGPGSYGASGGYGNNRYQDESLSRSRGPGGYGGLGRTDSFGADAATLVDDDNGHNEVFDGAKERAKAQSTQPEDGKPPQKSYSAYPGGGADIGGKSDELFGSASERYEQEQQSNSRYGGDDGGGEDDGLGGYGAGREMKEEELEEQDIQDTKAIIKQIKEESLQSLDRSIKVGEDALSVARGIATRLAGQGERLHNTEKNLDMAINHNKVARERTAKLDTLNRSMFAVHIDNPFGANARHERMNKEILDQLWTEREQREVTRRDALDSRMRVKQALKDMSLPGEKPQFQRNLAAHSKYQFEPDESDDDKEDAMDKKRRHLEGITGGLHEASLVVNRELKEQNNLIGRVAEKSDVASDGLTLNLNSLSKIR